MELMKDYGRWSFRQPKKQRNVGVIAKTHWDYLMDEMVNKYCHTSLIICAKQLAAMDAD